MTEHAAPTPSSQAAPPVRLNVGAALRSLLVPIMAVVTAVLISSIFILAAGLDPFKAFSGLLNSAVATDQGLTQTFLFMCPLLLSGLSVAFAFKGGLFNIGAQGQLAVGALTSAWAGFALNGLPPVLHIPLALLAGFAGGAIWGLIPGALKAYTGAHEVISTIMMNYIANNLLDWAVAPVTTRTMGGPLAECIKLPCAGIGRTPFILDSAMLPVVYSPAGKGQELHLGVFIAIAVALVVWIILYRTTLGFELRMVGLNPDAARYSGISVNRLTMLTMLICGGLAGLAGAIQTQGVFFRFETAQSGSVGFDSIAVALLAASNPIGIIPSSFLFGVLAAGARGMQLESQVQPELIQVIQALILMFVAADQIIRYLYRIKARGDEAKVSLTTGWGRR